MKIAIIGASAGTGLNAVNQALKIDWKVSALSRSRGALPEHDNLTFVKGSATDIVDIKSVLENTDAALITIGSKKKKGITLFSEMARAVVAAADEINYTKPILIVSGFGVGAGYPYLGLFMKIVINLFLKDQYRDKELMEDIFARSKLNWIMFQPGMLTDDSKTGNLDISSTFFKGMQVGKISRSDLANYLLKEAKAQKHIRKKVVFIKK